MTHASPQGAQRGEAERSRTAALRTFIAVDLDAAARAAAADLLERLRGPDDGVRWLRPEVLHVTLRFLGDVEPARVAPLARHVGGEVASCAPFRLELGAARLFPSPRRPRVVALEVAPEAELAALAAAVERGVRVEGLAPEERPFRPHLTLGRIETGRGPATRGLAADGACPVSEVVLFRSDLGRGGSTYTPLERMALGGG